MTNGKSQPIPSSSPAMSGVCRKVLTQFGKLFKDGCLRSSCIFLRKPQTCVHVSGFTRTAKRILNRLQQAPLKNRSPTNRSQVLPTKPTVAGSICTFDMEPADASPCSGAHPTGRLTRSEDAGSVKQAQTKLPAWALMKCQTNS